MTQHPPGGWEAPSPHPHQAPRGLGGRDTVLAVPKARVALGEGCGRRDHQARLRAKPELSTGRRGVGKAGGTAGIGAGTRARRCRGWLGRSLPPLAGSLLRVYY